MDPASMIIGLGASLTTLSGLILESVKTLYKAQGHFKEAPRDISRLCWQLREFESLLKEVQSQIEADCGPQGSAVQTLVATSIQHMQEDLQEFSTRVQQLNPILDGLTTRRKRFGLRLRHVLTESRVTQYQQLISSYSGTLTLLLALNSNFKLEQLSKRNLATFPHFSQSTKKGPRSVPRTLEYAGNSNVRNLRLPFGVTAASSTIFHGQSDSKPGRRSHVIYQLTFVPPRWLSALILQWEFRFDRLKGSFPALGVSLNPIRYNSDPRLIMAIKSCDAVQLRGLLNCGLARADDYLLLRRRPVLLLEAIAPRSASCDPERVLETYQCLLTAESFTNGLNLAFSHAQVLISLTKRSKTQLNSALNTFCSRGGNIFWSEPVLESVRIEPASTILSLISRHGAGFNCLEEFIFRQSEPWTTEDLSSIDRWLLGVLANASHTFRISLDSYLRSYKCVFTSARNNYSPLNAFDLATIVSEVADAPNKARIEFVKILVKWGIKEMLHPFFSAGFIDLEESAANEMFPWLRLSYLSKAVRWGNKETFEYLLGLGACPIRGLAYLSRFPDALPQETENIQDDIRTMILKMADHALSGDASLPIDGKGRINHNLLLALLLRTSNLRAHSQRVTDELIQKFINSNSDQIVSCSQGVIAAYIIFALVLDLPSTLKHFVHQTTTLEANFYSTGNWASTPYTFSPFDPISPTFEESSVSLKCSPPLNSFSWASLAVELALPECLQVLLDSWKPSDAISPTAVTSARSEVWVAEQYANGMHALKESLSNIEAGQRQQNYPRTAIRLYTWPCQIPQRHVEKHEDEQTANTLRDWIQKLQERLSADSMAGVGKLCDHKLSGSVEAAITGPTSKLAQRTKAVAARFMITATQLLWLQAWEIVVLCLSYIITLALFIVNSC